MQRKNSKNTTDKLFVPSGALGVVHVSVGEVIIFRPCQGIFHNEKIVMQHGAWFGQIFAFCAPKNTEASENSVLHTVRGKNKKESHRNQWEKWQT